ncbi:hypothetical protein MACH09_22770 [Vibrio sp. MACH09]|nr:hypothetical protein MACH09_22770 [Vibrio sp. MACH09]
MSCLQKDKRLKPDMSVVDLGAALAECSQYAALIVGDEGQVIVCDILPHRLNHWGEFPAR